MEIVFANADERFLVANMLKYGHRIGMIETVFRVSPLIHGCNRRQVGRSLVGCATNHFVTVRSCCSITVALFRQSKWLSNLWGDLGTPDMVIWCSIWWGPVAHSGLDRLDSGDGPPFFRFISNSTRRASSSSDVDSFSVQLIRTLYSIECPRNSMKILRGDILGTRVHSVAFWPEGSYILDWAWALTGELFEGHDVHFGPGENVVVCI